jgi:serpin B
MTPFKRLSMFILFTLVAGCSKTNGPPESPALAEPLATSNPSVSANTAPTVSASEQVASAVASSNPPTVAYEDVQKLATSSNAFGFDLYARLRSASGNLAISPASISAALAMTQAGARGETETEMRHVLHTVAIKNATGLWGNLSQSLQSPARPMKLRIANRLFGEATEKFETGFLDTTQQSFNAPLERLDFKNNFEPARVHINQWVEAQTEKRITNLLPPKSVDKFSRLVLVNAVYFLADWQTPFEKSSTREDTFKRGAGSDVRVQMMNQVESLRTAKRDGAAILELPYRGGSMSMLIVLPDSPTGLAAVEAGLSAQKFTEWRKALAAKQLNVSLPRFEVSPESLALKEHLMGLGMMKAFDRDKADFTGIANPADPKLRLKIDSVVHKAFVKVDEKGTEAAAATAVMMAVGGAAPAAPDPFRVDHPFLYAIVDNSSGLIVFMGRVNDPTQK